MPCKVRGGRGACHRKFQDDHPTHDPGHILRRKHQRQPEKGASHVVEAERLQEIAPQIDAPVPQQIARFHRIVHQHVERDLLGRKIMRHRHISMVFDEHGRGLEEPVQSGVAPVVVHGGAGLPHKLAAVFVLQAIFSRNAHAQQGIVLRHLSRFPLLFFSMSAFLPPLPRCFRPGCPPDAAHWFNP